MTTPEFEFNTLAPSAFSARLTQASLIIKTDFYAKLSGLNLIQDGLFRSSSVTHILE